MKPKKHVPQRTCVACRTVTAQRDMVRLVSTGDSRVEVDPSGSKAGRGAYLCRSQGCWDTALKSGRLEHALKTVIPPENREELTGYGKCL